VPTTCHDHYLSLQAVSPVPPPTKEKEAKLIVSHLINGYGDLLTIARKHSKPMVAPNYSVVSRQPVARLSVCVFSPLIKWFNES